MVRNPETRRKLAILAIFLGIVFILGVLWSVLTGQSEWWTLVLILPAGAIMRRLSGLAARPARPRSGTVPPVRDEHDGTVHKDQKSEP